MKTTREVNRQIFRGYDVNWDADKFKMLVALDQPDNIGEVCTRTDSFETDILKFKDEPET